MKHLKRFLKRLFGRTSMCIIGILFQLAYLVFIFWTLGTYYTYSYLAFEVIGAILTLYIISSDINPSYKIAWIVPIMAFPIFGVMLYLFFGRNGSVRKLRSGMEENVRDEREWLSQNAQIAERLDKQDPDIAKQVKYLYDFGGYPVYDNTSIEYFPCGEAKFEALIKELEKAEKYIFLEYFIVQEGKMWNTILEILSKKAAQGVDVRMVYDDIGCLLTLPYKYDKILESLGIKCRVFNKFKPFWSSKMNNRDHRKIFIIDGKTAFTGGINLADEYINEYEKHGHWKDSAVMLKGDAVRSFTMMFFTMWDYLSGSRPESFEEFLPPVSEDNQNCGLVVPFTDSPLDDEPVGENVYLNIINNAKKYVYITTPYLILDNEMATALTLAARSGIDIRIITPHVPDKWYVHAVTRANYKKLVKQGVRVYEYTPGFIHAKNFVSDDETAVVGTINLDFRSLYLHFECAAWMNKSECIADIKRDFLNTLNECREITLDDCNNVNIFTRMLRVFLRLFAPMM